MSVPSAPDPQDARQGRHPAVTALLVIVGIILLLPGLCTLYFARELTRHNGLSALLDLFKGGSIANLLLLCWGVSLVLTLLGAWLLRRAWRRKGA
jgi:hypothetical protein